MDIIKKMSLEKFQAEITVKDITPIQVITFALNAGAIVFLIVTLYLYFSNPNAPSEIPEGSSYLDLMLYIMLFVFIVSIFTSKIFSKRVLLGKMDSAYENIDIKASTEKNSLLVFNTHHIIKLAILEGSTLFGLVVLLYAALNGMLNSFSPYWLGLLPLIYFLFISFTTFPTKEKIIEVLKAVKNELELEKKL